MRIPFVLILLLVVALLADFYIYRRNLKEKSRWIKRAWWGLTAATWLAVIIGFTLLLTRSHADINTMMWIFYTFFLVYAPRWLYSIFSLLDYLPRPGKHAKNFDENLPRLGKWESARIGHFTGVILAMFAIAAMLYGAFYARKHPVYTQQVIESSKLPEAFDGYRIVLFSDLHLETLGSAARHLPHWVEQVNAFNPDLILFTGDLVNRQGGELRPHMETLSRLSAIDGVYSVLGNHDYGDYNQWDNPGEQETVLQALVADEERMGWRMLNNRSEYLRRGNDSIALIGVENWGMPPFPQYGKLSVAYPASHDSVFKILLSHNPLHWRNEVIPQTNINLTLSGHTHAMQMKFGWDGFEYSLAAPLYPEWGGLYTHEASGQMLYVNEGIGCVGVPMRIGARPEFTIITLKRQL